MVLLPIASLASDSMDTSDGVAQARQTRRQRNSPVANAAEPRVHHHDGPTPSFVIVRSEQNPMSCAYVLNAQSNDQLALVPWANTKNAKSGFKIMHCTYAHVTRSFTSLLNEPTFCVAGFCTKNSEGNLYTDLSEGLRALWARMRIVNTMRVHEHFSVQEPREVVETGRSRERGHLSNSY